MALDFMELYAAVSGEAAVAQVAKTAFEAIKAVPVADRRAAMYAQALGIGGVGLAVCQAYDSLHAGPVSAELVMTLVGVDPNGLVGKQFGIIEQLLVDIKD